MLSLIGLKRAEEHDVLLVCTGTLLCLLVSEVAFLQICDVTWDMDASFHEQYVGAAAVGVYRRKNDTGRKGHFPRLGRAQYAEYYVVQRLRRFTERRGIAVQPGCTKESSPGARCRFCPPLLGSSTAGKGVGGCM